MSETTWAILLLIIVAALVYGAFLLGRASALSQVRQSSAHEETQPVADRAAPPTQPSRTPSAAPPPVLAGGERTPSASAPNANPSRRSAPPPAAAAGPSSPGAATHASAPRRTAAPPPAAAAWDNTKNDKG